MTAKKDRRVTDKERRDKAWGRYADWLKERGMLFTLSSQRAFMVGWESKKAAIRSAKRGGP